MLNWLKGNKDSNKAIIVVGDVHGDLNQLMYPLLEFLKNEDKYKKLIYLGDYIDRGESNLYIYGIIKFIRGLPKYKDKIIFLRGNHETYDSSIRSFYEDEQKNNTWDNKSNKTFVFNTIFKQDFDIVHYDQDLKIVFSHSPMTKSLDEVLAMNTTKHDYNANIENTFTEEKRNANINYKNIHGHIHRLSNDETIDKFFRDETKTIAIDGDASYGIRLVSNFVQATKKNLVSNVVYLIIYDEHNYKLVKEDVEFGDYQGNYNVYRFNRLKDELRNSNSYIGNKINELKLDELISIFEKEFRVIFRTSPTHDNIINLIQNNYKNNVNKKEGTLIYFYDVPVEVYNKFGWFKDELYNEVGKLFWNIVGRKEVYEKNYLIKSSEESFEKVKRSEYDVFNTFIIVLMGVVSVVLIVLMIVNVYIRKSREYELINE